MNKLNKLKGVFKTIFQKKIIITAISISVFAITFFSKNGIISSSVTFIQYKKHNKSTLTNLYTSITNLENKIQLLKERNKEIIEIINHDYKNIVPYGDYIAIEIS